MKATNDTAIFTANCTQTVTRAQILRWMKEAWDRISDMTNLRLPPRAATELLVLRPVPTATPLPSPATTVLPPPATNTALPSRAATELPGQRLGPANAVPPGTGLPSPAITEPPAPCLVLATTVQRGEHTPAVGESKKLEGNETTIDSKVRYLPVSYTHLTLPTKA